MKQEKKTNFIMQAGILAAAGIIVRIIGILYRSPLVAIIGDEGNGYYSKAYNIYTIILLVASYSIPSALSKVMAAKIGMGQYKNAHKLFKGALIYVIIVGGLASLFCYFCADSIVGHNSATVLKVFSPTIFLSGLLGCLRGYFQAQKSMLETSVSQILEQILNAIVSIMGAYLLIASVAGSSDTTKAVYGAIGSAIGTGSGVLIALLLMFAIYLSRRKNIRENILSDTTEDLLSGKEVARILLSMVTPIILSTCIYNLSTVSNLKIYEAISQKVFHMDEATSSTLYGLFSGKAVQIINIPVAIATAMSAAIIPVISSTYERREYDDTKAKIAEAIKTTMLIAIPAAAGLFVLSRPVTLLLYPQAASVDTVSSLIKVLSITVVFYCLSTLSNGILQGTGFVNRPVVNAAISLIVQAAFLTCTLLFTDLGLYALCGANIVYSLLMCISNSLSMRKTLSYKQEIRRTFVLPAIAAVIMGLAAFVIYFGIEKLLTSVLSVSINWWSNAFLLMADVIISVLIYFVAILKLKAVDSNDLLSLPKGRSLVSLCKKLHLL